VSVDLETLSSKVREAAELILKAKQVADAFSPEETKEFDKFLDAIAKEEK